MNVEFLSVSSPVESLGSHLSGLREIASQLEEIRIPEILCGIYFLVDHKQVVYVGQSVNTVDRMYSHIRNKRFCRVLFVRTSLETLNEVELYWIKKLKPPLNKETRQEEEKLYRDRGRRMLRSLRAHRESFGTPTILELGLGEANKAYLCAQGIFTIRKLERSRHMEWAGEAVHGWRFRNRLSGLATV